MPAFHYSASSSESLTTQQQRLDEEVDLLGDDDLDETRSNNFSGASGHNLRTAPVLTGDALRLLGSHMFPQRATYGRLISQHRNDVPPSKPAAREIFINTNAPFSAVVCGVQGSGKSHSTSVLLESCLISNERLGILPEPVSGLVFHFDTAAGGGLVQPCEAAYLSALDNVRGGRAVPPPVTVLVLPTNLVAMTKVYAALPDVTVKPLHFAPEDISGERLLAMMKVDENSQMPLYMEAIMAILRTMDGTFNYIEFRRQLEAQKFNPSQKTMLNLRLSLLDSCLKGGSTANSVASNFRKGQLTIIDISSPFMDPSSACGFFDIILGLFVEAETGASGKLVVLDEAHKYLSDTNTSSRLTESLLTVVRQQRHLGTRVVISTQEPTVIPPKFLELCSFIIAHRFSSPKWLKHLAEHVSAAGASTAELLERIVNLETGHAIMFSPSALVAHTEVIPSYGMSVNRPVVPLGQGFLLVRSRLRITHDGGHSLLSVQVPADTTRPGRVAAGSGNGVPITPVSTSPHVLSTTSAIEWAHGRSLSENDVGNSFPSTSRTDDSTGARSLQSHASGPGELPTIQDLGASDSSTSTSFLFNQIQNGHASTSSSKTSAEPEVAPPDPNIPATVAPLITYMRDKHRLGVSLVNYQTVRQDLAYGRPPYFNKPNIEAAVAAGVNCGLLTSFWKGDGVCLRLTPIGLSGPPHPSVIQGDKTKPSSAEPLSPMATTSLTPTESFAPIIRELQIRRTRGELQPRRTNVRKSLKTSVENPYGAKDQLFHAALDNAVRQGAVILGGEGKTAWLELPA